MCICFRKATKLITFQRKERSYAACCNFISWEKEANLDVVKAAVVAVVDAAAVDIGVVTTVYSSNNY